MQMANAHDQTRDGWGEGEEERETKWIFCFQNKLISFRSKNFQDGFVINVSVGK